MRTGTASVASLLGTLALAGSLSAASVFSPLNLDYKGIVHAETEQTPGKDNNSSFPAESNSFATFYNDVSVNYDVTDTFFVTFGGKANLVLGEDNYNAPIYLRAKQTSDELDTAIVSAASATYDNGVLAFSAGRIDIDYDWLLGSMDGFLATAGSDDSYSLRLFWFRNFTQLQYNYAFNVNDMNDGRGMYGAIAKAAHGGFEATLYDYYLQELRNIAGGHITYTSDRFGINLGYTGASALGAAAYDLDESFAEISLQWLFGHHFIELGGSLTGENGLLAMVQLGSFMFGQFYLSNQVDRDSAQNGFVRYIYGGRRWRWELLAGATRYDNRYVRIENGLSSYETDGYVTYAWSRAWALQLGAMWMNVDERDPIGVDQTLLTGNLVYRYEYF